MAQEMKNLQVTRSDGSLDPVGVFANGQHGRGASVFASEKGRVRIQNADEEVDRASSRHDGTAQWTRAIGTRQSLDANSRLASPPGSGDHFRIGSGFVVARTRIGGGLFRVQEPLTDERVLVVGSVPADRHEGAVFFRQLRALLFVERQVGGLSLIVEHDRLVQLEQLQARRTVGDGRVRIDEVGVSGHFDDVESAEVLGAVRTAGYVLTGN